MKIWDIQNDETISLDILYYRHAYWMTSNRLMFIDFKQDSFYSEKRIVFYDVPA